MSDLTELLERVRRATGPDGHLERAILDYFFPDDPSHAEWYACTHSIDAALALVEREFPNSDYDFDLKRIWLEDGSNEFHFRLFPLSAERSFADGAASFGPGAILTALLRAKLAQEPEQ